MLPGNFYIASDKMPGTYSSGFGVDVSGCSNLDAIKKWDLSGKAIRTLKNFDPVVVSGCIN